jgi:catechol 2,3-dioxygenase-like lactoylglutathione lyase family enzyme
MMNMIGMEHLCINVSDLERSIKFYKKLGFKILRKTTRPHAMMYLGNDLLEIIPQLEEDKKKGFSPPFPYHLAFYSDNLEEDVRRLKEQGIEPTPIVTISRSQYVSSNTRVIEYAEPEPSDPKLLGCMIPSEDENHPWRAVRFNDPDGIILEIWQRR